MITTENSSIFRLLTKESMLLTSATFLIEKEVVKEIPPYFKNQSVPIVHEKSPFGDSHVE
jgi:hypothetical protein